MELLLITRKKTSKTNNLESARCTEPWRLVWTRKGDWVAFLSFVPSPPSFLFVGRSEWVRHAQHALLTRREKTRKIRKTVKSKNRKTEFFQKERLKILSKAAKLQRNAEVIHILTFWFELKDLKENFGKKTENFGQLRRKSGPKNWVFWS